MNIIEKTREELESLERDYPMSLVNWSVEDWLKRIERAQRDAIQAERDRLVGEIEKIEIYDDELDNCRRIISEIKHLINNK